MQKWIIDATKMKNRVMDNPSEPAEECGVEGKMNTQKSKLGTPE